MSYADIKHVHRWLGRARPRLLFSRDETKKREIAKIKHKKNNGIMRIELRDFLHPKQESYH